MTTQQQIAAIQAAATESRAQALALVAGKVLADQKAALVAVACSVYTSVYDLVPDAVSPPPPPPARTFTATVTGDNKCTVGWSGVSPTKLARDGVDTYGGGPWDTGTLTDQPTSGTFEFSALVPGDTYTYTMTYGTGQTMTVTMLQPVLVEPPPPVVSFTAAVTGTNECTVSWSGVSPTKLGRDGVDTFGGGPWDTGTLTNQPSTGSFQFAYLVPGNTYTYTLTYGSAQTLTTAKLQPTVVAAVPGAVTLTGITPGDHQVTLTWATPSNGGSPLTAYVVCRSTKSLDEGFLSYAGPTENSFVDTTALNKTKYYYRVWAANAIGGGPWSNELSATPDVVGGGGGGNSVGFGQAPMSLPTGGAKGYSASDLIFHDTFSGGTIDLTKWWPREGAGTVVWNSNGTLACPYSGGNLPLGQSGQFEGQLMHPNQIVQNDGLTYTIKPNTNSSHPQYNSESGCMTTYSQSLGDCTGSTARHALPNTGWYAQILAQQPDMQNGCSGSFWFLSADNPNGYEIDVLQGCFGIQQGAQGADINRYPMACGLVASGQANPDVGVDASLGFHKYGCEWIPGTSLKMFFDGRLVANWSGGSIPSGVNYEMLLHAMAWYECAGTAGWTTRYNGSGTYLFKVAEVAIYRY